MFIYSIIEAAVLASSLSIDAFTAGFAYGSKKIHIPMSSIQIINLICCFITALALLMGAGLRAHIPEWLAIALAFTILFIMGLIKLLDGIIKSIILKHAELDKSIQFSLFSLQFILRLYADPEAADADVSSHISPSEAIMLAVSLSLDGIAVGFGAALAGVNPWALLGWSLVTNILALIWGRKLGHSLAEKLPFNISWLGGLILIGLAFSQLI
ncbi:MAG: manganese efflux pump [Defluviitaleaceae bacterium]|nr:manganese efflux pump [Defluviitaleaceae bacterium]